VADVNAVPVPDFAFAPPLAVVTDLNATDQPFDDPGIQLVSPGKRKTI
jgi:hypothetical protein